MSVQDIYNRLRTVPDYHPASVELFDDFTIEAGDVVSVQSGTEHYALPVFSSHTVWNGAAMVTLQSMGEQERQPMPALQRKLFASGRGAYRNNLDAQAEFKQFETFYEKTDERFSWLATESEWDELSQSGHVTAFAQLTLNSRGLQLLVQKTGIDGLEEGHTLLGDIRATAEAYSSIYTHVVEIDGELEVIDQTGLVQNSQHIIAVAGKFDYDEHGNVLLEEGAELKVTKNGIYQTVGSVEEIDYMGTTVQTNITGSAFWVTADQIVGANGILQRDAQGNLHVIEGSGLFLDRQSASFGVYDEGNLTGGVVVDKLNDGTVQTLISGDVINLNTNTSFTSVVQKTGVNNLDPGETLYSQISQNSENIELKVNKNGVISSINQSAEAIQISASKIDLDGYVTMGDFEAMTGYITNLTTGQTLASRLLVRTLDITDNLFFDSVQADWRTIKIGTVKSFSVLGALPSATEQDFDHSHTLTFSVSGGEVTATLGEAVTKTDPTRIDSFNIADTAFYQDGVSAARTTGQNEVTIVQSAWDNGQVSFSKSVGTPSTINLALAQGNVTWNGDQGTLNIFNVYNDQHVDTGYTVRVTAPSSSSYNDGWAAAYNKVDIPGASTASTSFRVRTPASTVDQGEYWDFDLVPSSQTPSSTGYINAVLDGTTTVARVSIGSWFTAGRSDAWTAAYNKVSIPGQNTSTTSFRVWTPASTIDTREYWDFSLVPSSQTPSSTGYINAVLDGTTTVARVPIGSWYTAGEDDGWDLAYGKVVLPSSDSGTTSFTVKTPGQTKNTQSTTTFTVTPDSTPSSSGYARVKIGNTTVAKASIGDWFSDGYTAGEESVSVRVSGVAFDSYNESTKEISGSLFVYLTNSQSPPPKTVIINAEDAYDHGYREGAASVSQRTVTDVYYDSTRTTTYSTPQYTIPVKVVLSDGTTANASINVTLLTGSYNETNKTYPITVAGNSDRTLDASTAYNKGKNDNRGISRITFTTKTASWYNNSTYSAVELGSTYYEVAGIPVSGSTKYYKLKVV